MMYLIITVLLLILILVYFRIADKYGIVDKPNSRSSHTSNTIRGGGILFPITMLLCAVFFHSAPLPILIGMLLISMVSFIDDIFTLPNRVRLIVQFVSVGLLLFYFHAVDEWPIWLIVAVFILIIGIINAYNFMDGVNGMTGLYSLIALGTLLYINNEVEHFTDSSFIICPIIGCLIFLFFNFRQKAKSFAGDVGSVGIAFWIIALLMMLIVQTGSPEYILLLAIYGIDTILTIVHRLILRQNIFEAHRLHFYQILANDKKVPHLVVSSIYGIAQLIINAIVLFTSFNFTISLILVTLPLIFCYIILKPRWTAAFMLKS